MSKLLNAASIAIAFSAVGCTVWVPIKPTELPKVSSVLVAPATSTQSGRTDVLAISVARVEREDGRMLEVTGKPDVRVTCADDERRYEYPVVAEQAGSLLKIRSKNYAPAECDLGRVTRVEVVDAEASQTRFMWLSISASLATIPLTLMVAASASK